jgi:hypothetical protein
MTFEIVITQLVVAGVLVLLTTLLRRQDQAGGLADGRARARVEGRMVSLDTGAYGTCG